MANTQPGIENKSIFSSGGKALRSAVAGSMAGGIFFFGLALAILSGHFWTALLVTVALMALIGSHSSSRGQAIFGASRALSSLWVSQSALSSAGGLGFWSRLASPPFWVL